VTFQTTDLVPKRLELLHEIVPAGTLIGLLINPAAPQAEEQMRHAENTARVLGARPLIFKASTSSEIDAVFATLATQRVDAFQVANGSLFFEAGPQLAALAGRHGLPTVYPYRETVEAGGLMSYGPNIPDAIRLAGTYVGRILHGERPTELPVVRPTKFELVINQRAANAIGLTIPETLLATADEVIQ
jgi:putative ABC transport system substrate-binding protein